MKPDNLPRLSLVERLVYLLNGISTEAAILCPEHERNKLSAWGLTILAPALFGGLAAAYIVATLVPHREVIVAAGVVWGGVVLAIDRAILAGFRATAPRRQRRTQALLRFAMAGIMGLTVSHPLVLRLFESTVQAQMEAQYQADNAGERSRLNEEIAMTDQGIAAGQASLSGLRTQIGQALAPLEIPEVPGGGYDDGGEDQQLEQQIAGQQSERESINREIEQWQQRLEDEVAGNGISGKAGYGTEAKRIETQELAWRRETLRRISATLGVLQQSKTDLIALGAEQDPERSALIAARMKAQRANLEQIIEGRQLLASSLNTQIETVAADVEALRRRRADLVEQRSKLESAEPDDDILAQTLAMHHLILHHEGGWVAATVYGLATCMFLILDLIPLTSKLLNGKPGCYDLLLDALEQQYQARMIKPPEVTSTRDLDFSPPETEVLFDPDEFENPMTQARAFDALSEDEQRAFPGPKRSKWRKLLTSSPGFQRALERDVSAIGLDAAYRLACVEDQRIQLDLLDAFAQGHISGVQLDWRIKALKTETA